MNSTLRIVAAASAAALLTVLSPVTLRSHEGHERDAADSLADLQQLNADSLAAISYKAVEPIFKRSCFDCHSDQTVYPWYFGLPLVKGMIERDIRAAHKNLDMSQGFPFKGQGGPRKYLKAIREQLQHDDMPLWQYRLAHPAARLSDADKQQIYDWIAQALEYYEQAGSQPAEEDGDDDDDDGGGHHD